MKFPEKKWKDVLHIVNGKNQKEVFDEKGEYPIYGSGGPIGKANDYLCEAGTTIIGRKGTIDSPIYVNQRFWNIDTAFGIAPGKELNSRYLFFFCSSFNFKELDKSTTLPSLAKRDLEEISMPVPPLAEQERIVAKIEELFSQLDAAVTEIKKAQEKLDIYRRVVLNRMFNDMKETKKIRDISLFVTSGSRGWAKYYSNDGAKFIRIGNLTHTTTDLDLSEIQHVSLPSNAEGTRSLLSPNDVLVSITADLGSIGLVPNSLGEAYINQHIAMIRFKNPVLGSFFAWYLRSDKGQKQLLKNRRGNGKFGLGLDDIRDCMVPIVSEQDAISIVDTIEQKMSLYKKLDQTINKFSNLSNAFRQSILKQAFEGKL